MYSSRIATNRVQDKRLYLRPCCLSRGEKAGGAWDFGLEVLDSYDKIGGEGLARMCFGERRMDGSNNTESRDEGQGKYRTSPMRASDMMERMLGYFGKTKKSSGTFS